VFALDLHTHTRFFHGFQSRPTMFDPVGANLLERVARRQGLDGVATTNHDYGVSTSFDDVVHVPGIEISTSQGHVLVVGPDPPDVTNPGEIPPKAAVDLAHAHGCVAIIAHPYRNSTVRDVDAPFDAVELNGKHPADVAWVRRLAARRDLPIVGGSDAHYPVEVGRAYTVVDADVLTPETVVQAIRDGRVSARVSDWFSHRVLRRAYLAVHTRKGHLQTPEWVTDTVEEVTPDIEPGERTCRNR